MAFPLMEEGTMDRNRILELAVETLEKRKAGINAEIETLRAELKGTGFGTARKVNPAAASTRRRRLQTRAERKAHSEGMKAYWAAKRAKEAKASAAKKSSAASGKRRAKSAAEKKALSLKMKQVWEKRKAEALKKNA
jgi:uncharacterized protein (UPF0335 family)